MSIREIFIKLVLILYFSLIGILSVPAVEVIYNREIQAQMTNMYVSSIAKDKKGFMWFGTSKGLNRWDGYRFKQYFSDKENPQSLSGNRIQYIYPDPDGSLWIGTSDGLNRYDPQRDVFTHYLHSDSDSSTLSSNNVVAITKDLQGKLWIGTYNKGLNYFDEGTGAFKKVELQIEAPFPFDYNQIRSLFCDSSGIIWVGFNYSGLVRLDPKTLAHQFFFDFTENRKTWEINGINYIAQPSNHKILLATWGGKVIEVNTHPEVSFSKWKGNKHIENEVADFVGFDQKGGIWVVDKNTKIIRFDSIGNPTSVIEKSPVSIIPSNQISSFFVGDENIWLGTYNNGFFQINYTERNINDLPLNTQDHKRVDALNIKSISKGDDANIYISTFDGELFNYDMNIGLTEEYNLGTHLIQTTYYDTYSNQVLIGDYSKFIKTIQTPNPIIHSLPVFNSEMSISLFATNDTLILFTVWSDGLYIYNKKSGIITHPGEKQHERSFSSMDLLLEDHQLWIATFNDGLLHYNLKTMSFRQFNYDGIATSMIPTKMVNLLKRLHDGRLLVISTELGICIFNEATASFHEIGSRVGIYNDIHIKGIEQDKEGTIWIFTDRKIMKTNPEFDSLTEFTILDGLNLGIQHKATFYCPETDRIYFGGHEGMQFFDIKKMVRKQSNYPVVITDIQLYGKSLAGGPEFLNHTAVPYSDTIRLSHQQDMVTIEFAALQYNNFSNVQYRYMLEGINKGWITVNNHQNSVTYSNLSPGDYTFLVKSSDEHGIWSEDPTRLTLIITPPFWMTTGFKFFAAALLIALVWSMIKLREISYLKEKNKLENQVRLRTTEIVYQKEELEKQKEELVQANEMKNKFFHIIAHDLKNPVSSVTQLIELLYNQFESFPKEKLREIIQASYKSINATRLLLEDLLLWARSQTQNIRYEFELLNLRELIDSEILNLEPQSITKSITIKNKIPKSIRIYADSFSLKTVFRNLISNALKFSYRESEIEIGCTVLENEIQCSIRDFGVGMSEKTLHKLFRLSSVESNEGTDGERGSGLGLNLCMEFIKAHGGKIQVKSESGQGSTFIVSLPYHSEKEPVDPEK